jgi:hypothetical protein
MEAAFKFLTEVLKFIKFWNRNKAGEAIVRTAEIYDIMRTLVDTPAYGIGRVLITYSHNGGFNFKAGKPQFNTTLHEMVRYPFKSVKARYTKYPLDEACIEMLTGVYLKKQVDYVVAEMGQTTLRELYTLDGVERTRIFFLKHTKEAMWIMSVSTANELVTFNEIDTKVALTKAVSDIKARI